MPNFCGPGESAADSEEARLKRLAIVIAAQMPGDPKRAVVVLGYLRELIGAYSAPDDMQCDRCTGPARPAWVVHTGARQPAASS